MEYILYFAFGLFLLEILMIIVKRMKLIGKLKKACKAEGYTLKFVRNRFLSVFFAKGKFDLLIEGHKGKYAVVILTSRHRNAKWQFYENKLEIYKRRSISIFPGNMYYRRKLTVASYTVRKARIKLYFNSIASKYPLHENICLINPAPNEVAEARGNTVIEAGDTHRLSSGFKLFGLSGFIRYISTYDDVFGIKM